jgi:hypothetical protein
MKTLAIAAAVAGLVCLASAPLRAQGEFPLKQTQIQESDPIASMGRQIAQGQREKPPALKALPPNLSADLRFYVLSFGETKVLAVLDNASPARLFVDSSGTGDLAGATALTASGPAESSMFGPAALPGGAKARFRVGCMTVVAVSDWPMKDGRTCRGSWEAGLERPIRRMGHGGRAIGRQTC